MTTVAIIDTDDAIIEWATVGSADVQWQADSYRRLCGSPAGAMEYTDLLLTLTPAEV